MTNIIYSITSGSEAAMGKGDASEKVTTTQITSVPENLSLTETIASVPKLYSEDKLPPTPGKSNSYEWKLSKDAPEPDPGFNF